uniref:hAT-like transposase RNase-H fold domain-containing protein n=1 Tax=Chenopodium quinoa TaxID=63459 RepID=A0A803N6G2_CHEQI
MLPQECMESGSSGDMEDSSATSQAPPIPSPPPEPWEYDPCPMTENNDPFEQQNQSNQPSRAADAAAPLSETSKKNYKKMVVNLGMSYRSQMGCLNLVNGIVLPLFFLKIFYDATLRVSGSLYITSNVYLQELVGISVLIKKKVMSNDVRVSLMASGMKKKHDKYWENVDNVNLLLYIAVILDPRRKMGYTKWAINQLYDSEKAKYLCDKVMQTLNDMYELYVFENPPNESIPPKTSDFPEEVEDMDSDVDVAELEFEKEVGSCVGVQGKNELAKYLEDDREVNPAGKSFDCLGWWKKY